MYTSWGPSLRSCPPRLHPQTPRPPYPHTPPLFHPDHSPLLNHFPTLQMARIPMSLSTCTYWHKNPNSSSLRLDMYPHATIMIIQSIRDPIYFDYSNAWLLSMGKFNQNQHWHNYQWNSSQSSAGRFSPAHVPHARPLTRPPARPAAYCPHNERQPANSPACSPSCLPPMYRTPAC